MVQSHLSSKPSRQKPRRPTRSVGTAAACVFSLCSCAFFCGSAFGYSPFTSLVEARLRPDRLELTIGMDLESAWRAMGEANSVPNVAGSIPRLRKEAARFCRLSVDGQVLVPGETDVDFRQSEGEVILRVAFPRPPSWPVRFDVTYLDRLPDYHQTRLILRNEATKGVRVEMLTAKKHSVELALPSAPPLAATSVVPPAPSVAPPSIPPPPAISFWALVKLGFNHMLTSYDQILFLCGLLVVCRRFSSALAVVIAFTVGYSLTLALATLNIVAISSQVAEPLIAATIVFVGVENLARRGEPRGRWLLTLPFGLIHGFGFAHVLREANLNAAGTSMIRSIFPFNLGVELGQLAVLAVLLPVLWKLRRHPTLVRYAVPAISIVALLLGGYWLLDSTVFV